jgi:GNAT superfamily N-acetyltransferase
MSAKFCGYPVEVITNESNITMELKEKARIVESAEAALLAATFAAAPAVVIQGLGMKIFQLWGGVASIMVDDPTDGYCSRIIGMGIDRPITKDFLEAIDSLYISNNGANAILQVSPIASPADFSQLIEADGYKKWFSVSKFLRELNDIPESETKLKVRELTVADANNYSRVYWAGFGISNPHFILWGASLFHQPDWRFFGVFEDNGLVGVAPMYVRGDVVCLPGASVLEGYRNRGGHSALMVARLQAAFEMDLSWASSETFTQTLDRPNLAIHNLKRLGFEEVYERESWIKNFDKQK